MAKLVEEQEFWAWPAQHGRARDSWETRRGRGREVCEEVRRSSID